MIKEELNKECGKRLKQCLKEQNISQKDLSVKSNYTQQYISSIIVGKRNLSLESARRFSRILNVREEYLLCEDNFKTIGELDKKIWYPLFEKKDSIAHQLLNLAGFDINCDFIKNWYELGLDKLIYGPFLPNTGCVNCIPFELEGKVEYSTEITAPNGKVFYCDYEDISMLGYELIEYINFRMKQLESKYAWKYDDGAIMHKRNEASTIKYYKNFNSEIFYDLLGDSGIWTNHESPYFPDMSCYACGDNEEQNV